MSARRLAGILLLAALARPGTASAAGWDDSFPASALATHLPSEPVAILVAVASSAPATREAASALAKGLRATPTARLVMDDSPLGSLVDLSDAQIASKSGGLPIDLVAIVRVFPGRAEGAFVAVVTLVDKQGAPRGAFTVDSGTALQARNAPAGPAKPEPPPAASPAPTGEVLALVDGEFALLAGAGKRAVAGAGIYRALGDAALLEAYQMRSRARFGLVVGGGALAGAGAGLLAFGLLDGAKCAKWDTPSTCFERKGFDAGLITGASVAVVAGMAALVTGRLLPEHPIDLPTLRFKVDEHNRRLQAEIALTLGPGGLALHGNF